jgi:hypothetical protein
MTDEDLKAELDRLEPFEGRVGFMYLDNATRPNVTCGVGYLISSVDEACRLPWHHSDDGLPASPAEISADFLRVSGMRGGMQANAYKGSLRLAPDDIDAEGYRRLRAFLDGLPDVFPGFVGFPDGVQQALLDLAWNCGLAAPKGLAGWTHLRAACNSVPPNWANRLADNSVDPMSAAAQCRTANPNNSLDREHRNDWRSGCFISACAATPAPDSKTPGPTS